jgi:signal transduction histidine kinase
MVSADATRSSSRLVSLRLALLLLAVFALLLGIVQLVVGATAPTEYWVPVAFTLVFGTWAAAGVIAWWRRPASLTGPLLLLGALGVFLGGIGNLGAPVFIALSAIFATIILAVTVHLLLAFPSGRLRGGIPVATVAAVYVVSIVLQAPFYLVPPDQPGLLETFFWVQRIAGVLVVLVTAALLIDRLRTADRRNLRVLLPLYLYGILAVLLIPVSGNLLPLFGVDSAGVGAAQLAVTAGIPIAFLLGTLLGGFASTVEADALSAWLATAGSTRSAVEQALARSLGDDSLRVAYWSDAAGGFVDSAGREVLRPPDDGRRLWHEVHVEARLVGAISYDARMIADREAVGRAGSVLAIALDRERLTTALMASNEALGLSRLRIVETADRERSRIARDLHDGIQVQLVLLALEAQQIANDPGATTATATAATTLRVRVDEAAADLRRLVHDVLPSALVERGLSTAVEDLVDRLAIPAGLESDIDDRSLAPATAQTAYLIVAEALTNAVKHSEARLVRVELTQNGDRLIAVVTDDGVGGARIDRGTGLKGLADRVDALGGSFDLRSDDGDGTELRVELPCGS